MQSDKLLIKLSCIAGILFALVKERNNVITKEDGMTIQMYELVKSPNSLEGCKCCFELKGECFFQFKKCRGRKDVLTQM